MKNIREIVSSNISTLRRNMGLTQIGLAKKINFSDKAVSRWEKGEVLPDIETLESLAKIFGVSLTYMLEEHTTTKKQTKRITPSEVAVALLAVCIVWCIATVIFVYLQIIYDYSYWKIFIWAVPATAITVLYFNRKWNNITVRLVFRMILNWTFLTAIYLQLLHLNMWLIFVIGVPVQVLIIVAYVAKLPKFTKQEQLE